MGAKKFMLSCANDGVPITEDFAKHVVSTYRDKFNKIVAGWNALEDAAIRAVRNPQTQIKALKVVFLKQGRFLSCRLPSGRKLHYFDPILMDGVTSWGKPTKKLTYMSLKTGAWIRVDTYGGKFFENVVQALCRDLVAAAIARVELGQNPYDVVLHTHDDVAAEVDKGVGSLEEFEELISALPWWATGFPLTAEGWRGERFRK
jgi:DNA polymerase